MIGVVVAHSVLAYRPWSGRREAGARSLDHLKLSQALWDLQHQPGSFQYKYQLEHKEFPWKDFRSNLYSLFRPNAKILYNPLYSAWRNLEIRAKVLSRQIFWFKLCLYYCVSCLIRKWTLPSASSRWRSCGAGWSTSSTPSGTSRPSWWCAGRSQTPSGFSSGPSTGWYGSP